MSILSPRRVVRAIKIPYLEWFDNKYGVCLGIIEKTGIKGEIVFGVIKDKIKHCWIKSTMGELIDPVCFSSQSKEYNAIKFLYPYDAYKNHYIEKNMSVMDFIGDKCPPMTKGGKRIRLFIDRNSKTFDLLRSLTKYNESCTVNVMTWIANVPYDTWGDHMITIYDGIIRSGYDYLISKENMAKYKSLGKISEQESSLLDIT